METYLNKNTFKRIYEALYEKLHKYAFTFVRDEFDAQDITQEI